MIQNLLDWFGPFFSGEVGYLVIAVVVLLERGAFTGLVAPGDVVLALGGVFAGRGTLSLPLVALTGVVAGIAGETFSYWLGRRFGRRILRRFPFRERMERYLHRTEEYFREHGRRAVFVGRYISVVGTFLPFTAGMSKMPFGRFLVADVVGMAIWATGLTILGYFLSAQVYLVDKVLSRAAWGVLGVVVIVIAWRHRSDIRDRIRAIRS
ncbi:MAG TPA: DedA family protein [Actinomycetota bacterium]|nr:DedA family protein [Actinomycetota bacterium]